jgi:hypothetical protein
MPNNVYVHPTVSWDIRHIVELEKTTGRRIEVTESGQPMLAPIVPLRAVPTVHPLHPGLEARMRNTLTNLAGYTAGHDPKGAA